MSNDSRPSWTSYYIELAKHVATRATCPRLHVGAVVVRDNRILVTGYNGSPSGVAHCTEIGCLMANDHCERSIHAEANAIIQAAVHGVTLVGATAYVTHQPCRNCTKLLVGSGIRRVIYAAPYADPIAAQIAAASGMEVLPAEPITIAA
jgi:dCMP deaminase